MSMIGIVKSKSASGEEVFTLDEGRVTITFPPNLSSASLNDLKQYLDIFYRKACRLSDDPVDSLDPKMFERKKLTVAAAE